MSIDVVFSTDSAPEGERFDAWREFSQTTFGVLIEPYQKRPADFRAEVKASLKGPLAFFRYQTDGAHLVRGPSQIAGRTWNGYMIQRERGVGGRYANSDKEIRTRTGAVGLAPLDLPWLGWADACFDHDVLVVPTVLMEAHLPRTERPAFTTLPQMVGTEALAADYFDSLARQWNALDEAAAEASVEVLCRLIGVALGSRAVAANEAVTAGRLAAAKRLVERRLADPRLKVGGVAAALGISERTLEAAFAEAGLGFAAYVRRRRLEECREALRADPSRLIADIAYAWGFNSLSAFYRGFAQAFGLSPAEFREEARHVR
jgi:AraC-like DNA-binding protein